VLINLRNDLPGTSDEPKLSSGGLEARADRYNSRVACGIVRFHAYSGRTFAGRRPREQQVKSLDSLPIERIREYAEAVREFLRGRVQFDYDHVALPEEPNARALRYWCSLYGVLAHEIGGSALELSRIGGQQRSISILNRCLFEYWIRLKCYLRKPEQAAEDLALAKGRFRSIAEAFPADYAEVVIDEEDFEKAFEGIDTKVGKFRRFIDMLDTAMRSDKEVIEASYRYYYALQSIYAHGNEAAFVDLSHDSDLDLPVPGKDSLDWTSLRLSEADVISATTSLTSYILHLIEAITGRGAAFVVLGERYPRAVRAIFGR
jgi:hypothetical protein